MKLNEYLTVKHGLIPKEEKDAVMCFRPSLEKDEYFELDFLYEYKGLKRPKIKAALFSVSEGRNQRYYARVDFQSGPEPWSIQLDLPARLADTVLSHLDACRKRVEDPLWDYRDARFYKELAEYVEDSVREKFNIPPREEPPKPDAGKVVAFRKKK